MGTIDRNFSAGLGIVALCAAQALLGTHVQAQPAQPADWPCEQVLVPRVSAAVVWDGPPVDEASARWEDVPAVAALVSTLTSPRLASAEAERLVAEFAAAAEPGEREAQLTLLFAGVLETLNDRRADMIAGIRRFTRAQAKRASRISERISELEALKERGAAEDAREIAALEETLHWEERIFDEREQSIRFLCEQPVTVEERLGTLARTISAQRP